MVTATTITDEQCRSVYEAMPYEWVKSLLDGALAAVEPHRNHSRHELAILLRGIERGTDKDGAK